MDQLSQLDVLHLIKSTTFLELDQILYQNHQKILNKLQKTILPYGTAGFRDLASNLYFVALRVGVFLGFYSRLHNDKVIGIQISASHNKYQDNGLKIIGWDGGMLEYSLEKTIEIFCNQKNLQLAVESITDLKYRKDHGSILIGQDTRPSCEVIRLLIIKGISQSDADIHLLGALTTPQVQFAVWSNNLKIYKDGFNSHGRFTDFYQEYFTGFFKKVYKSKQQKTSVIIDCANGVGWIWVIDFKWDLADIIDIQAINCNTDPHTLNNQCGSEYVQVNRRIPNNFPNQIDLNTICLSFDGDADRIVFLQLFFNFSFVKSIPQEDGKVQLLDGDKFSFLFTSVVQDLIIKIKNKLIHTKFKNLIDLNSDLFQWKVGIIQTAYANGASTKKMRDSLNIITKIVPTGVKHLHKAAQEFDIGVYFEANGHGTILMSRKISESIKLLLSQIEEQQSVIDDLQYLHNFLSLASQATGDSIANFLLVLASLSYLNIGLMQWLAFYEDYPSKQYKVKVTHKQNLKTNFEENQVVLPLGIQDKIEEIIKQYGDSYRCFIRASGTEDVIRIYCEGNQQSQIEQIISQVEQVILKTPELNKVE